jgi:hypothetical protein
MDRRGGTPEPMVLKVGVRAVAKVAARERIKD